MKRGYLKWMMMSLLMAMFATTGSAQFLKKLGKIVEQVEDASKKVDEVTRKIDDVTQQLPSGGTETTGEASDTLSAEEFLKDVPFYTTKKVIEVDDAGNPVKNEDGTIKYSYRLVDKYGNVGDETTAKKLVNAAWKKGGIILAKIGGGAAVGAGIGAVAAKDKKKGALIGTGVGAAVGLLASSGDIKALKQTMKQLKACKKELSAYEKTFTEEGTPIDANVDLSDVDGFNFLACEEVSKTTEQVKNELLASKQIGESLGDESMEDFEIEDDLLSYAF